MIWQPDILARGDSIGEFAVLIIFAIMAAVSALIKWLNKKAAEHQAEMQRNRLTEDLEQDRQIEAESRDPSPPPDRLFPNQRMPGPPQMPQAPRIPQSWQRPTTIQQLRARQAKEEVILEPVQEEHTLVHAEVTMPSAKVHDPYAFRHDPGRPSIVGIPGLTMAVDLSERETLRQAIVFHELLGPPKAMRNEPEPWEL